MRQLGYSLSWFLMMFSMTLRSTNSLPDFMFGWTAQQTRLQARSWPDSNNGLLHPFTRSLTNDKIIFQGDIRLRPAEASAMFDMRVKRRRKRKITIIPDRRWSLPIPYEFDEEPGFKFNGTEKSLIRDALRHWEGNTCIRFQELTGTPKQSTTLQFKRFDGCWSYVGREKAFKYQEISIGSKCFTLGIIVHEVGHAIGFWHEHARPDREEYIRILYQNVKEGKNYNFWKETWHHIDNLNIPYDVGSIMHYGPTSFSAGGNTIETLRPLEQNILGQREKLSFYDSKEANLAYCNNTCSGTYTRCYNEGYPDPNACYKCKCPDGLGGVDCNQVAPSIGTTCGGEIVMQDGESHTITTPGYPDSYPPNTTCTWFIKAGTNNVVNLIPIKTNFMQHQPSCDTYPGNICDREYTEIKYRVSMARGGVKYCCGVPPANAIQSEANKMIVIFRTIYGGIGGFKFIVSTESCGGCIDQSTADQPACKVQVAKWCPKKFVYRTWVECPVYFRPIGWGCGQYKNVTGYRHGICLRDQGHCCGQYQLGGSRCRLAPANTSPWTVKTSRLPASTNIDDNSVNSVKVVSNDVTDARTYSWSQWSSCSHTCGGCGTRTRTRRCNPKTESCSSTNKETMTSACHDDLCPSTVYTCPKKKYYQRPCNIWSLRMCTRYTTYLSVCVSHCCKGYSVVNNKCAKDPS